jgi:hypothetical protein
VHGLLGQQREDRGADVAPAGAAAAVPVRAEAAAEPGPEGTEPGAEARAEVRAEVATATPATAATAAVGVLVAGLVRVLRVLAELAEPLGHQPALHGVLHVLEASDLVPVERHRSGKGVAGTHRHFSDLSSMR